MVAVLGSTAVADSTKVIQMGMVLLLAVQVGPVASAALLAVVEVVEVMVHLAGASEEVVVGIAETSNVKVPVGLMTGTQSDHDISLWLLIEGTTVVPKVTVYSARYYGGRVSAGLFYWSLSSLLYCVSIIHLQW